MYTLRVIQQGTGEVSNISLGNYYSVRHTKVKGDLDLDLDIKAWIIHPDGKKVIYNSDFSCIMTESGQTFEVLNRPVYSNFKKDNLKDTDKGEKEISKQNVERDCLERMDNMCVESLEPGVFEKWEEVKEGLKLVRKAFKA